jgi:hypothetical protein
LGLLAWMAEQPFERLLEGDPPLLRSVETVVVAAHRDWYAATGRSDWSEPKAYHWLRYEDPDPVGRLADAVRRLKAEGIEPAPEAVNQVIGLARPRHGEL